MVVRATLVTWAIATTRRGAQSCVLAAFLTCLSFFLFRFVRFDFADVPYKPRFPPSVNGLLK